MKKVLVAGSTGYLGKFAAKELKRQGYYVRALARNPEKLKVEGYCLEPSINDVVDEVFTGEVTKPETLRGVCDDIDYVFSSIGITRQKDGLSFDDVDYQGNVHLLKEAECSHVDQFMYIHVLFSEEWKQDGDMIDAKKRFVRELVNSNVNHIVIRPTGYFSDLTQFFTMARNGKVYLIGDGKKKTNPIHGEDLARFCVHAFAESNQTLDIGGPEILTYDQMAHLAFDILNKKERIMHISPYFLKPIAVGLKLFSKHNYGLFQFLLNIMIHNVIGPKYGKIKLADYYTAVLKSEENEA